MLAPPGSRSSGGPRTSRRAAKQETPDDVIRQLQKLPPNKRCCDCNSKLPSCVNLTVGSFVCMACAGIHREHGARVKGVGHSSFTAEEAGRLRTTDNEKINLMWLARYNPRVERVKPPQDNSNQQQLKSWIRRKYVEKMWYQEAGSGGQNGGTPQGQQARQTQQPQQPQPTMVQLPPREQQPPQK